ncbi:Dynamin, GTPase domain protein [Niveomyces insectorum RCEF 264]|uniref:Dynamin, GTPase domain protein n=1 Tax=Niveomyces insectorum RCEF 264 TaxID=1081102 RepID=A0A167W752_9HYPO|nr:Dynamin, GTPase domain protein [Niveomyces insectorum RCEF 264]
MAISLDAEAFGQLNGEQKALLDTVDSLRSQGVGNFVNLPQIVVVGDQSSGKSSVLEAISRVRFPVSGGICTRFATELVVRTSPQEEVVVMIQPGPSSSAKIPQRKTPVFNERQFGADALPGLIERAKAAMGMDIDAAGFSEDILHIEVSGPNLPSLTLVDLPGIYRNATADQTSEGIPVVWRLARKYMEEKRSIILAVVNASYDFSNQEILTEIKRHDPHRERSMGIVTSPDRLIPKSIEESKYVRLVRNQEPLYTLKYGWHVLRNRGPDANDEQGHGTARTSDDERDATEKAFFASGIWADVPDNIKGVDTLRPKLSNVLTKHIQARLPRVVADIERELAARTDRLALLGQSRATPYELRRYLHNIAENFRNLARLAVKGTYDDLAFFGAPYAEDYPEGPHGKGDARRLRAIVRNMNHAFDKVLVQRGARRQIIWDDGDDEGDADDNTTKSNNMEHVDDQGHKEEEESVMLLSYMDLFASFDVKEVMWSDLKAELAVQASNNQNADFPGSPNDRLALNFFRDQSRNWRRIAEMHLRCVVDSVKTFVELALQHVTNGDDATRDALLRECVDPFFEQRTARLAEKLDELLRHYQHGEALTLETDFLRAMANREEQRLARQMKELLATGELALFADDKQMSTKSSRSALEQAVCKALVNRTSQFGLEKVVNVATVYYDMSLRTFTENVIILAVENCLMTELPSMLTSAMVYDMDEDMLRTLAAESPSVAQDRLDAERDARVLAEGLRICKKYRPRESSARTPSHAALTESKIRQTTPRPEISPKSLQAPSYSTVAMRNGVISPAMTPEKPKAVEANTENGAAAVIKPAGVPANRLTSVFSKSGPPNVQSGGHGGAASSTLGSSIFGGPAATAGNGLFSSSLPPKANQTAAGFGVSTASAPSPNVPSAGGLFGAKSFISNEWNTARPTGSPFWSTSSPAASSGFTKSPALPFTSSDDTPGTKGEPAASSKLLGQNFPS